MPILAVRTAGRATSFSADYEPRSPVRNSLAKALFFLRKSLVHPAAMRYRRAMRAGSFSRCSAAASVSREQSA